VTLRRRLLVALVLVSVAPIVGLAAVSNALLSRRFEAEAAAQLARTLEGTRRHLAWLRGRVAAAVAAAAVADVPAGEPLDAAAARRGLDTLQVLDAGGLVLASRHWPAGVGLPDKAGGPEDAPGFRLERVAAGHGSAERLTLWAAHETRWGPARATLRGGAILDGDRLAELQAATGAELGLYGSGRWTAPGGSPLQAWRDPPLASAETGRALLGGRAYRWRREALGPSLFLVAAVPEGDWGRLAAAVSRSAAVAAGAALAVALIAALALSRRVAEPVAGLAAAARRVREGDWDARVPEQGPQEIQALARAFNEMTAELRASRERLVQGERVAAWREMAERLAHDLKAPLFPIQLSIETLRRAQQKAPERFPELFQESSATILQELGALRRTVEGFGEFARMPAPRLAPCDLNALARQATALFRGRAGLELREELDASLPAVPGDPELLGRALANLLSNGVEAMPEGGRLTLRSGLRGRHAALEVEDDGPGMDEEQRRRLFHPRLSTKPGGSGLGLATVQAVAADHGGRLEVRSQPGQGSSFTLLLPLAR
jgi:signal transduction histidine kinase